MKKICIVFFLLYICLWTTLSYGFGDEWQNIKYKYMHLVPPPPSMDKVPFNIQSEDYNIYSDTYYKCMLGYEHSYGCTYWYKYAKENNIDITELKNLSRKKAAAEKNIQALQNKPA